MHRHFRVAAISIIRVVESKVSPIQIFQKFRSQLKILGVIGVTGSKFHIKDPNVLGTSLEILAVRVAWRWRLVRHCFLLNYIVVKHPLNTSPPQKSATFIVTAIRSSNLTINTTLCFLVVISVGNQSWDILFHFVFSCSCFCW